MASSSPGPEGTIRSGSARRLRRRRPAARRTGSSDHRRRPGEPAGARSRRFPRSRPAQVSAVRARADHRRRRPQDLEADVAASGRSRASPRPPPRSPGVRSASDQELAGCRPIRWRWSLALALVAAAGIGDLRGAGDLGDGDVPPSNERCVGGRGSAGTTMTTGPSGVAGLGQRPRSSRDRGRPLDQVAPRLAALAARSIGSGSAAGPEGGSSASSPSRGQDRPEAQLSERARERSDRRVAAVVDERDDRLIPRATAVTAPR